MAAKNKKKDEKEVAANMTAADAQAVIRAAQRLFGKREDFKVGEILDGDMEETASAVDKMDKEFKDMDVNIRVMQVGPNGQLTDVSDKVNPRDLKPNQIADLKTNNRSIPLGPDGRIDKERAMEILSSLTGKNLRPALGPSDEAMQRMERTLAKSDEILKHFKD